MKDKYRQQPYYVGEVVHDVRWVTSEGISVKEIDIIKVEGPIDYNGNYTVWEITFSIRGEGVEPQWTAKRSYIDGMLQEEILYNHWEVIQMSEERIWNL